ncbi:hypothetical protein DFA_05890 [Cavenderia fasciculata]|uniref:Uncharacterized protein n=1 Tax=Cavenderia fasciculata TaxID=261658 RepID=F4PJI1_CACFS|nr:uncharacterized protein DFA_05890 [Cavenderia fasciculata]EGG23755.1 hypothetical protein DFA_05890 [Cavenderia fasciculata]|eukprot:XP_004361606.1 hypothetical protein DFA_05890 [Cavenderia fasciculata]
MLIDVVLMRNEDEKEVRTVSFTKYCNIIFIYDVIETTISDLGWCENRSHSRASRPPDIPINL